MVADNGIARKVGKLKEGDRLVFINDVECTSRANAIETVKMGKSELKIKLKRIQSVEEHTVSKSYTPKRSNSFYGSVVEDMLDSVCSDISSTHYSRRRDTIRGDKSSPRRSQKSTSKVSPSTSMDESEVKETSQPEAHFGLQSSNLPSPSDESPKSRGNQLLSSSRNFQRVKVKSVKVTSMIPGVKSDISQQLKTRLEAEVGHEASSRTTTDQLINTKESPKQTQSMDEGRSTWTDPVGHRKATTPPALFANRTFQARNNIARTDSTEMNVSQAKSLFDKISRSQEMLDKLVKRPSSTQRQSPTLETRDSDFVKPRDLVNQATLSKGVPPSVPNEESGGHARTKSLPVEKLEGPRRDIRRPGTAPMRRSTGKARPKSAHLPSEGENLEPQYLPLGYGAVPTGGRIISHGRKSIATCAPSTDSLYRKEASFRHSSEDLRPNETFAGRSERKASTLPANQMREAAKKFHLELLKKDPKYRYSMMNEPITRPVHHGSSAGGSSSSSLNSSQDQINTVDQARRLSNGPNVFSKACSTTSLDSSPGQQETPMIPTDDENTILSRLLREQRLNSNSNLVRIEEEARSPRGKTLVFNDTMESQETIEIDEKKGKRTISIQTDFIPEISRKRESFSKRHFGDQASQPLNSSVQNFMPVETCIDDVDPLFGERANEQSKLAFSALPQPAVHTKELSSDSIAELDEINGDGEQNLEGVIEEGGEFPVTDIDALPPPPDELLIASPPEKEKPQRVINRKKRDPHANYGASRNSSCVSTDSNISTSTMDSGIGVRPYSMSDSSPRNSPTTGPSEFEDDYNQGYDEGFKGSREELLEQDCQTYSPGPADDGDQRECKENELPEEGQSKIDSPTSENGQALSPRIEELDNKKATLIDSIQKKIEELKLQEQEIGEEIKLNEDLGKRVRGLVERKANQTEFSKYELFIGELNKIVALLLSLTQRLHRYEQMLQDLDMSEEEDKQKRETLVSKIDKLRSQHEEACHLREVNDRRGENVANFLDKYFNEEEFADFQYYVDMKSQLALMQSEIKEKVKLGEERYQALYSTGKF